MTKTMIVCLFVTGMLAFILTGFVAEPPGGVPPLQRDQSELVVPTENPILIASFNCGDGYCDDSESCCYDYSACCPSGLNIFCSGSFTCYESLADAQADCGDDYYICASPAN